MVDSPTEHQHQPPCPGLDIGDHLAVHHRPVHLTAACVPAWRRLRICWAAYCLAAAVRQIASTGSGVSP